MKKVSRMLACSLALLISLSVPSYGWNKFGHMVVAGVAYQNLKPDVRKRVDELVKLNPDIKQWRAMVKTAPKKDQPMLLFMLAATWPDRIKDQVPPFVNDGDDPNVPNADRNVGYKENPKLLHKYWHFIDTPFSQDGTNFGDTPKPNAITQIKAFRKVISSDDADDKLKSFDLVWLLHLIGDVHQPLHCSNRFSSADIDDTGDHGGNRVKTCTTPRCKANLHSFWDDLLGTKNNDPVAARGTASRLEAADETEANILDPEKWAEESFELSKTNVYIPPVKKKSGTSILDQAYRDQAHPLARQRVALAGARLANFLNKNLK